MTDVSAVIVSFRPEPAVLDNIIELSKQVGDIVVVDNGSPAENLERLREGSRTVPFRLIENGSNLGIAAALNRGVRTCAERGSALVAFFDQDSTVTPGYFGAMQDAIAAAPRPIAVFCPRYVDRGTRVDKPVHQRDEFGEPLMSMTSGSVIPMEVLRRIGPFEEELFIYGVDDEFCLRARSNGLRLLRVEGAVLLHQEGRTELRKQFGRTVYLTNQPPKKRYYIARNQWWLWHRYAESFPALGSKSQNLLRLLKQSVRILLLESDKIAKLSAMIHGFVDFCAGRMGKTVQL